MTVIGYIGHGTQELMRQVLISLGVDPDIVLDTVMPVFDAHYDATVGTLAQPYPGVPEALARSPRPICRPSRAAHGRCWYRASTCITTPHGRFSSVSASFPTRASTT